jgi:hypothetical protein
LYNTLSSELCLPLSLPDIVHLLFARINIKNVYDDGMRKFLPLLLIFFIGCQSASLGDVSKMLVPINAGAAYFGAVGLHELGHAGSALAMGSNHVNVSVLPARDQDGNFHLGLTTAESTGWSQLNETIYLTMGPTASFVGHVGFRELLKSGVVPQPLQPTMAWLSLGNQAAFYFHVGAGLARIKSTDLGKEEAWISAVMLLGGFAYDIYDLARDGGKNFKVMFGEEFYDNKETTGPQIRPISAPLPGGGFLGIQVDW